MVLPRYLPQYLPVFISVLPVLLVLPVAPVLSGIYQYLPVFTPVFTGIYRYLPRCYPGTYPGILGILGTPVFLKWPLATLHSLRQRFPRISVFSVYICSVSKPYISMPSQHILIPPHIDI